MVVNMFKKIRFIAVFLLVLFPVAASQRCARAQAPTTVAPADSRTIEQLLNPTTIVVAQFDLKKLNLPTALQDSVSKDASIAPLLQWLESWRATLEPVSGERIYMAVDVPASITQPPIRFIAKKPAQADLRKLNEQLARFRFSPIVEKGEFIVTSPTGNLAQSEKNAITSETLPGARTAIPEALATVAGMPVQILVLPPDYLWATYRDLMPRLPESLGGAPTGVVIDGVQWASLGFDPASMKAKITVQSNSPAAAAALAAELPKMVQLASQNIPSEAAKGIAKSIVQSAKPVVKKDRIEIEFSDLQDLNAASSTVAKIINAIVDPLNTREKMNRFKQLALGVHNYESASQALPPNKDARNADGSSNFSWRVHILPYIGEAKLYAEFKLDQPWDSEHNQELLAKMPDVYSAYPVQAFAPASLRPGYTTIVAPVGEGTIFGGKKPVRFSDITDGTSNTILFVEVKPDRAVPWTAPLEYEFNTKDPAAGLAVGADGQFLTVLGDGSVQLLPGNLPKETLNHLFQMNDGNVINF